MMKEKLTVSVEPGELEKIDQIQDGLHEINPPVSRSEVIRHLLDHSIDAVENGEMEVQTADGEINLRDLLND